MALGLGLIIAIILFKYKPTYVVSLCGEQIGYVSNAAELQNRIQSEIIDMDGENIDFVTLDNMPKYELKLVEKSLTTNEDEIMLVILSDLTYVYVSVLWYYICLMLDVYFRDIVGYTAGKHKDDDLVRKAITTIKSLTEDVELGKVYMGKVTKILQFGALVEVLPGKEGLLHISQISNERIKKVEDVLKVGDDILVKVTEIGKDDGKFSLTAKDLMKV